MAGDISVIDRPRARTTPTWGGVMRRCSSTCCAVRVSPSQSTTDVSKSTRPASPRTIFRWPARPNLVGRRLERYGDLGGKLGINLQSSTLKNDETGEAFHVQQAAQIRAYRAAWKEAGHAREPGSPSAAASSR